MLNPESWVEQIDQCKMIALQIIHSKEDENEEYIAECRWARFLAIMTCSFYNFSYLEKVSVLGYLYKKISRNCVVTNPVKTLDEKVL